LDACEETKSANLRLSPQHLTPMKIISFNANGIRSAANKGFFEWLRAQRADVVCVQETKAQEDQLTDPMFRRQSRKQLRARLRVRKFGAFLKKERTGRLITKCR